MASTIYASDEARERALQCARGRYQRSLLEGPPWADWDGRDLVGYAKVWSAQYWYSRRALLRRMRDAGLIVRFVDRYVLGRDCAGRWRLFREPVAIVGVLRRSDGFSDRYAVGVLQELIQEGNRAAAREYLRIYPDSKSELARMLLEADE